MTQINLPRTNQTGTNEWSDVETNDAAIAAVVNGQLQNDNVAANAQIAHSKLADATAGKLLIANASGVITATTASGDVTVAGSGAVTIANDAVTAAKLRDDPSVDANRAVTTDHIRDDAITSAKIATDAVDSAEIAADAVKTSELDLYTGGSVTTSSISLPTFLGVDSWASQGSVAPGTYLCIASCQLADTTDLWWSVTHGTVSFGPTSSAKFRHHHNLETDYDAATITAIVTVTATSTIVAHALPPSGGTVTIDERQLVVFGIKD